MTANAEIPRIRNVVMVFPPIAKAALLRSEFGDEPSFQWALPTGRFSTQSLRGVSMSARKTLVVTTLGDLERRALITRDQIHRLTARSCSTTRRLCSKA